MEFRDPLSLGLSKINFFSFINILVLIQSFIFEMNY